MPHMKSAWKRMRTSVEDQGRNKSVKSGLSTAKKQLLEAVESGDKQKSQTAFNQFSSLVDKASKKGIIKKGTGSRSKSRAAALLAKVGAAKKA